jgi:hypothetical protein
MSCLLRIIRGSKREHEPSPLSSLDRTAHLAERNELTIEELTTSAVILRGACAVEAHKSGLRTAALEPFSYEPRPEAALIFGIGLLSHWLISNPQPEKPGPRKQSGFFFWRVGFHA